MMIYWMGLPSEIDSVQQNLGGEDPLSFRSVEHLNVLPDLSEAGLFLILPSIDNPVKAVHELAAKDKFLSIIILTDAARYNQLKKAIQFSPFVGKATSLVIFNPSNNYSSVFSNAILRTRQKRTFHKYNLDTSTKLSHLTASAVKLDNLGNILEHAPIGAMLLDKDLKVIGANKASRDMFAQLRAGELQLSAVFPRRQSEAIRAHILEGNHDVLSLDDVNGNYFEVSALRFPDGTVDKFILLVNDVTERILKDKRIKDILESLPQISWTASPEGKMTFFSQGWYNYTNLSASRALGDQWTSVIHPDDVSQVFNRWQQSVTNGKSYQQASRLRRFDGEYRWHLTRAVPVYAPNRDILLWVGTSTDIHEQVLLTENLDRMVKERTRTLEEKNAELQEFAHISSHDLQEPLRKIQTFAHIIKDEGADLSAENLNRYIDKIILTSSRMSKLIRDLLNFTQIDQREEQQLLDLNDIMHQIHEDLEVVIHRNSAVVDTDDLPTIKGRPLQIKQLFYNIINNSIKFRKPDTPPRVSIRSRKLDKETRAGFSNLSAHHDYHEIIIKDNGIGFDQKYADQIFTVFQRLHNRSAYEGTGIGLSIARKVVSNHRGEIFAISSVGAGAEFHIILPATQKQES